MEAPYFWHVVGAIAVVAGQLHGTVAVCRGADRQQTTALAWSGRNLHVRHVLPSPGTDQTAPLRQAFWPGLRPNDSHHSDSGGRRAWQSPFGLVEIVVAGDAPLENGSLRVPGEFERQETLVLAAGGLAEEHPSVFAAIIRAAQRRVKLVGIVANSQQRSAVLQILQHSGLPANALVLIETPHNTIWVRDYGPVFAQMFDTQRVALDAEYACPDRTGDNEVPAAIAPLLQSTLLRLPIVLEGGNFLSNGQGICITTTKTLDQNAEVEDAEVVVRRIFGECFGSSQTVFLEPLSEEPTGHVDMFALFTAPNVVVIGAYDPQVDPENAAILDRNAERLVGLPTSDGPLRVFRIPMPDNRNGPWRTYTNAVFVNGTLLVPVYPDADPETERIALEILRRLLPGWRLASINVSEIIVSGGALHCIVANVPAAVPRRPNARRDQESTSGRSNRSRWTAPPVRSPPELPECAPSSTPSSLPGWNRAGMSNSYRAL